MTFPPLVPEKRQPLQRPLIPSLKSSSATTGKENGNGSRAAFSLFAPTSASKQPLSPLPKRPINAMSFRTTPVGINASGLTFSSALDQNNNRNNNNNSSSGPLGSGEKTKFTMRPDGGVLRYGETIESLFRVDEQSDPEYHALCRSIVVDGVDDAVTWRRALELAMQRAQQEEEEEQQGNPSTATAAGTRGADLIRLHRRATSRFTDAPGDQAADILAIWLSYAKAQALYGSEKDARYMFLHIQNQRLGEHEASFYLALAELEQKTGNPQAAVQALKAGIEGGAQPVAQLHEALKKWEGANENAAGSKVEDPRPHGASLSTLSHRPSPSTLKAPRRSPKRKLEQLISPKRRKTETGKVDVFPIDTFPSQNTDKMPDADIRGIVRTLDQSKKSMRFQLAPLSRQSPKPHSPKSRQAETRWNIKALTADTLPSENRNGVRESAVHETSTTKNESKESIQFQIAPLSRRIPSVMEQPNEESSTPPAPTTSALLSRSDTIIHPTPPSCKKNDQTTKQAENATPRSASLTVKSIRVTSTHSTSALTRSSRPPLLSKTPFMSKTPLLKSRCSLLGKPERVDPSRSLDLGSDSDDEDQRDDSSEPAQQNLGHPKSKPKITKADIDYIWAWEPDKSKQAVTNTRQFKSQAPSLEKIDEAPPSLSSASTGSLSAVTNDTNPSKVSSSPMVHSGKLESSGEMEAPVKQSQETVHPEEASTRAGSNAAFLPLVSESNMLRVNNISYAKLGVIGRGGSCKVYRGLSKDCNVLAIKKIKLGGMEKKAIDGYSNEIALLKRLRGNPAIIQMFDSEVDLDRKAIFLVMELGEVDLNHVLQQQSLARDSGGSGNRRHLNMNFIRLTWYQMLTAVHSIHEERIIHGDLKPANFLFVRGALKLIDFGIAKAIQSDDTTHIVRESHIGTLNYMSPEAFLDTGSSEHGARMKIGRASDIWSLGCILYQMVYGTTPFAALQMFQKLQAIVNPNHKISFPDNVDEKAIDAMKQCLQRKPEDRPPIVGERGLLNHHKFLNG